MYSESREFLKNTGENAKKAYVSVLNERKISGGEYGDVYEAETKVENSSVKSRQGLQKFILKKYSNRLGLASEWASNAIKNYNNARKAGLRVFPTFRVARDESTILMTNGNLKGWVCIGTNQESPGLESKEFNLQKLYDIQNYQELIEEIFRQSKLAATAGIYLPVDSFMFLVRRDAELLDFVIGDMDGVVSDSRNSSSLWSKNFSQAILAFEYFLRRNMQGDRVNDYIKQLLEDKVKFLSLIPKL